METILLVGIFGFLAVLAFFGFLYLFYTTWADFFTPTDDSTVPMFGDPRIYSNQSQRTQNIVNSSPPQQVYPRFLRYMNVHATYGRNVDNFYHAHSRTENFSSHPSSFSIPSLDRSNNDTTGSSSTSINSTHTAPRPTHNFILFDANDPESRRKVLQHLQQNSNSSLDLNDGVTNFLPENSLPPPSYEQVVQEKQSENPSAV